MTPSNVMLFSYKIVKQHDNFLLYTITKIQKAKEIIEKNNDFKFFISFIDMRVFFD